ncbi:SpoIIE family protein phosphatase [Streptomyces sp. WMMC500]|uniref:SpoIIE family protein phosphatase n=1 Tax=Streptomyces sp. WMMC500 TaxID=3015154 RepID=UPI00248B1839|nr:SpoIIE family protein phosphatase [Streptomyces sp. WMMC500]WBB61750.1 SpoIIE family protein phosphatase [Streptomyces sp. WMMC500]
MEAVSSGSPGGQDGSGTRTALPAGRQAPARARAFVRAVITERALATSSPGPETEQLADDAALLAGELVTNALIHAGTPMELVCQVETDPGADKALTGARIEVYDRQPAATVPGAADGAGSGRGLGLQIVSTLADSWGIIYRHTEKAVWCRLPLPAPGETQVPVGPLNPVLYRQLEATELAHPPARTEYRGQAGAGGRAGTLLAEASELLAGQLDENMVAALATQLMVPRLADWCAVWLLTEDGQMRLTSVWHEDEERIGPLRGDLENEAPPQKLWTTGTPWPWPESAGTDDGGSALAFSLVSGGTYRGTLLIGLAGPPEITDSMAHVVEDVSRQVAQALVTARQYTRQKSISRALQRRQLPATLGRLPGMESAIVYEPHASGQTVGGDFYDLFPTGDGRWCFLLGDVQGKDAEAMSVTGLTRHLVRLLAREGHGVESVLRWLNAMLAEDAAEAVNAGGEGAQPRFLSMVYGELTPDPGAGGAQCRLASAGHPLPLRMSAEGEVGSVVRSQLLLGIDEDAEFSADTFRLAPGETLLCVTDGVTERRDGQRLLDDENGLAGILRECAGMGAMAVAERIRQATHDFSPEPVEDDLAVVVLHAEARRPYR